MQRPPTDLLGELKRRSVFRVAAVYGAVGWLLFEVADGAFPRLGLPDWTVTLVLVLVLTGLPLALVLAWAFDLTPAGVQRASPAAAEPATGPKRGRGQTEAAGRAGQPRPASRTVSRIAVMGAVAILALAGGAFLFFDGGGEPATVDERVVMVMPFRVTGDASLGYLREGMVDLLAAKLTGEGGPRAVDSRTTLAAWRQAVPDDSSDLPRDAALRVTRSLGAGMLLLGEVVGASDRVTISATVYNVITGEGEAHSVSGSAAALTALVDRLAAELLAVEAGEGGYRLATLTSASLPALRNYLAGQAAFRRGRFQEAGDHYLAAVDADSTFALAGLALGRARSWTGYGPDYGRGLRLAWAGRDRLSERDRLMVEAQRGPNWPEPTPMREWIAAWDRAVAASPGSPEAWYGLADRYFHSGAGAGFHDWQERARAGFERSIALDSAYAPSVSHLLTLAVMRGDTATVRQMADRFFAQVGEEERYGTGLGWQTAIALEDTAALRRVRVELPTLPFDDVAGMGGLSLATGLGLDDVRGALGLLSEQPGPARANATWSLFFHELNTGQVSQLEGLMERLHALTPGNPGLPFVSVVQGTLMDGDTALAAAALLELEGLAESDPLPDGLCLAAAVRAMKGEVELAQERLQQAREAIDRTSPPEEIERCVAMAEAYLLVAVGGRPSAEQIRSLDRWALEGGDPFLSLVVASLADAADQPESALNAARRAAGTVPTMAPGTLMRARLAARLGLRDEAIEAYRLYLAVRVDVEPGTRAAANVEDARSELNALVSEV